MKEWKLAKKLKDNEITSKDNEITSKDNENTKPKKLKDNENTNYKFWQFTANYMKELMKLLEINHLITTPYHPMCNGLVENFNGTLKQMLRRLCAE